MPIWIFALELSYLIALIVLAAVYVTATGVRTLVPDPLHIIPVAWFGALGAVTISLDGMLRHNQRWEPRYNYWHVARPVTGAVLGTIAFLIFFAVVGVASGQSVSTETSKQPIVYFIVAFLVGYREETFRELIKRATDLLLSPGQTGTAVSGATGLSATPGAAGEANVSWQLPPGATDVVSYSIYRDGALVDTVDKTVSSYADKGVAAGGHTYTVTATDSSGGESSQSAPADVTVS